MRYRLLLLLVLISALTPSVHAGILFNRKKDKPDPKQRVPELIMILKTDKDADKRSHAAEELRTYDPAAFPEIVPALIDALQNDTKPGVRVDAVGSLGKIRPVSPVVGEALEQALSKDASMRVRLQARSALLQYHWAGYRSAKKPDVPPLNTTHEPAPGEPGKYPPAIDTSSSTKSSLFPRLFSSPYSSRPTPPVTPPNVTTKEPPLARPVAPPPAQLNPPAAPMPSAPTSAPITPMSGPTTPATEEGPRLP
jgi:hypothetical protein